MDQLGIKQNQYWKTIIDTMAEALMVVDSKGLIISVNQSMLRITGFKERELVGNPCGVLNCDRCFVKKKQSPEHFCALFEKKRLKIRCTLQKKTGETVNVFKNATVLKSSDGKIIGGVETLTDLSEALAREAVISDLRQELGAKDGYQSMGGKSPAMQQVYELITSVAKSDIPVIIYGESGTGKELAANAIHNLSDREKGPFVKVNCAALNESLLESELFGHVKGAFTGAFKTRIGRFEAAHAGDIFLDEIGDMPLSTQVKLLRVIEEKKIEKVGDNQPVPVNVRLISATNKDLGALIKNGTFREDLFYRIGVMPIHMPPLRERKQDLPLLINMFLNRIRLKTGKPVSVMSKESLALLYDYQWPGNVRELINAIEHAFVLCREGEITPDHLPDNLLKKQKKQRSEFRISDQPGSNEEKKQLMAAISSTGGNKSEAARILGISRVALYNRLKKYNIYVDKTIHE
ncbi:MAG: sigma 54-interacting transcriptional regulator [Desulfobacteraceae bacterium]|nr:sigma 54-interacting transcriptional regulator [Desulfobacteraceae bacterium]MBC2757834.1 sigma 54-interacting transcriptional regulator [Desulfobacteraceae bacterium]